MKVKDLIEKLTKIDDNLDVVFTITYDDFCTTTVRILNRREKLLN